MAKITQELAISLNDLQKAVFSQPTEKGGVRKVELRPLTLRGERCYQAECFENNKAFHHNFKEAALLQWARENLEGKYRQALLVTGTESRQFILKRDGSYKKPAAPPRSRDPEPSRATTGRRTISCGKGRISRHWWI